MPGGVEHHGPDLAGEDGGLPLLLADDDPAGEHLAPPLHHAQPIVGNIDQHVSAAHQMIHQVPSPEIAQQQAGAHHRASVEPGQGAAAYDAVGGQAVTTLKQPDRLLGLGVIDLAFVGGGNITELVEPGADLPEYRGRLAQSQGRHGEGRPVAGHGQGQQAIHLGPHRIVFRHLRAQAHDLLKQIPPLGWLDRGQGEIQLAGLELFARDQIHGAPPLLEAGQLAKRLVIEGTTLLLGRGLEPLPQGLELGVKLSQHRLLQLLFQLVPGLFGPGILVPLVGTARRTHHHGGFGGLHLPQRPAPQPHQVCQCQPILLCHVNLNSSEHCVQSIRPDCLPMMRQSAQAG